MSLPLFTLFFLFAVYLMAVSESLIVWRESVVFANIELEIE